MNVEEYLDFMIDADSNGMGKKNVKDRSDSNINKRVRKIGRWFFNHSPSPYREDNEIYMSVKEDMKDINRLLPDFINGYDDFMPLFGMVMFSIIYEPLLKCNNYQRQLLIAFMYLMEYSIKKIKDPIEAVKFLSFTYNKIGDNRFEEPSNIYEKELEKIMALIYQEFQVDERSNFYEALGNFCDVITLQYKMQFTDNCEGEYRIMMIKKGMTKTSLLLYGGCEEPEDETKRICLSHMSYLLQIIIDTISLDLRTAVSVSLKKNGNIDDVYLRLVGALEDHIHDLYSYQELQLVLLKYKDTFIEVLLSLNKDKISMDLRKKIGWSVLDARLLFKKFTFLGGFDKLWKRWMR